MQICASYFYKFKKNSMFEEVIFIPGII